MQEITTYDRNPQICGYVVTQKSDPELFRKIIMSCSTAFGVDTTKDKHDEEYPYLVSLYRSNIDNSTHVLAAYRVMPCKNANGSLYTQGFFDYSEDFMKIFPKSAEFGRSFSSATFAALPRAIAMHSFRSIWATCLAPFIQECEKKGINHFFGQVSIPINDYSPEVIKKIIAFFLVNFGSKKFFEPKKELLLDGNECSIDEIFEVAESCGYTGIPRNDLQILKKKTNGKSLPMLLKKYPELVGWNPQAIIFNMAVNSHVNTIDLPVCLNSKLFTEQTRQEYFSSNYNQEAFQLLL